MADRKKRNDNSCPCQPGDEQCSGSNHSVPDLQKITKALIVGTNLGGLGTLIASMASLISFKYAAKECGEKKGAYLAEFTAANLVFLVILLLPAVLMCAGQ